MNADWFLAIRIDDFVERSDILLGVRQKSSEVGYEKAVFSQRCLGWSYWVDGILKNTKTVPYNFMFFAYLSASPLPNTDHRLLLLLFL